jgi:signal transduction histidine kinase
MEEREQMIHELTQNNNELRQFSYITSHNLRGPLTNMIGILNLIETSSISDTRMHDLVDGLKKSTFNLNETLNDLIKILIIKENSQINIEKIHFKTKLNKVIESIKKTIQDSNTIIEYDFSQAEYVYFSRVYLQSILLNLISNAIKYKLPEVNPRIKIKSVILNGNIQLHISDNGLGMDWEKVKNKIFGLYQRFHNHKDSKGIGLYLVYAQVTALGGTIELKTEIEKGSTFIITFK